MGCCSLCAALLSRATNCAWCFGRWERRAQSSACGSSQVIRETSYRQEPKERTSLWECCHMCWGLSGDRTLHSELSGEDFRAVHHKLSTRLLRVSETNMYNSSVTTLSILSSTLESGPPHDNRVSHTSGIIFACVRLGWVPGWALSQQCIPCQGKKYLPVPPCLTCFQDFSLVFLSPLLPSLTLICFSPITW